MCEAASEDCTSTTSRRRKEPSYNGEESGRLGIATTTERGNKKEPDDYDGHERLKGYHMAIPSGTGTGTIGHPSILLKS